MLNHVAIMGRITHDLELRKTPSDISTISFSVACEDDYTPKDGGEKHTNFIRVTAWRGTAEFIEKYFGKGRMIALTGRLKAENYTDKNGNKRTGVYVLCENAYFANSKRDGQAQTGNNSELPFDTDFNALPNEDDGELPF